MKKIQPLVFGICFCLFFFTSFGQENFTITKTDGATIQSEELLANGRQKVIVFWSRYCRLCKLEMKGIRNIGQNWVEDYEADIVFVSLENYPSDAYSTEKMEFLDDLSAEHIYKLHDNNMQLFNHYKTMSAIPLTILLDTDGNLIRRWSSYDDGLEKSIGLYLKKNAEN